MAFSLYINPMYLNALRGPDPRSLTKDLGWNKPHIYKSPSGLWVCRIEAYLHHGQTVVVEGTHHDLNWAWCIMTDHLVRHNMLPTFAATKGPSYEEKEDA